MKKLLNCFLLVFTIIVISITFTACNKEISAKNLVGTYETYSTTVTLNGKTKTFYVGDDVYGNTLYSELMILKLNEDGTCKTMYSSGGVSPDIDIYEGTWELLGKTVILTIKNGNTKYDLLLNYVNGYLNRNYMSDDNLEVTIALKKQ